VSTDLGPYLTSAGLPGGQQSQLGGLAVLLEGARRPVPSPFFNAFLTWSLDSTASVPTQIRPRPRGLCWQGDPVDVGDLTALPGADLEALVPLHQAHRPEPAERVPSHGNTATREWAKATCGMSLSRLPKRKQGQGNIAVTPSDVLDGNARRSSGSIAIADGGCGVIADVSVGNSQACGLRPSRDAAC
jgi:hypothetical protein